MLTNICMRNMVLTFFGLRFADEFLVEYYLAAVYLADKYLWPKIHFADSAKVKKTSTTPTIMVDISQKGPLRSTKKLKFLGGHKRGLI